MNISLFIGMIFKWLLVGIFLIIKLISIFLIIYPLVIFMLVFGYLVLNLCGFKKKPKGLIKLIYDLYFK